MNTLIEQIIEILKKDEELLLQRVDVTSRNYGHMPCKRAITDEIKADVFSLGFSQTNGEGVLSPYYYLGVVLRSWRALRAKSGLGLSDGLDAAAERIVSLLHRNRIAGFLALFSKAVRVYEKHSIELTTRVITLDVQDGEAVECLFFYARPYAASSSTSSSGGHPILVGPGEEEEDPEESSGQQQASPTVIYVRGDAIWD